MSLAFTFVRVRVRVFWIENNTPIATDRWETLGYLVVLNQRAFLSEFVGLKVFERERERVHSCLSGGWEVG